MARNTGNGSRKGSVRGRTQTQRPDGHWVKRDTESGRIIDVKSDDEPFKGVAKETDDRRQPIYSSTRWRMSKSFSNLRRFKLGHYPLSKVRHYLLTMAFGENITMKYLCKL